MRRFMFTLVAGVALLAFGATGAMAHGHRSHHRSRSHHRVVHHVRHARIRRFGDVGTPGTPPPSTAPASVSSFDPSTGKLIITLSDGTPETGFVTGDTNIQCESQDMNDNARSDHGGGGGDQGGSGDDDNNGDNGDNGGDGGNANCSTANLTPGTAVFGAELRISSNGSVWKEIDLASSSTNPGDDDNDDNGGDN